MKSLPNLITHLEPIAEHYLTLVKVHPSQRYNYAARKSFNLPVIEVDQFGQKCKLGESWLYFAVPKAANLSLLAPHDRLYVGAQTQDRMFRGDGLNGSNYHHAEMRRGNGNDTPINFLASGDQIYIYRVSAQNIASLVKVDSKLEALRVLLEQPITSKKHLGWWFEQYILYTESKQWRWNTALADKSLSKLFS